MPVVLDLELRGPSRVQVPLKGPHAAIAERIDSAHHAPVKPFSIAPPRDIADGIGLRIGMLCDGVAEDLARSLERDPRLRLGSHHYHCAGMTVTDHHGWVGMAAVTQETRWSVEFCTPTTFRSRARSSPWADPGTVARGLAERWTALHPETAAGLDVRLARAIWVADVSGRSVVVPGPNSTVSGFLGRITYVGDVADGSAALFEKLLRFAGFAGIGSFTTFGFGQVRVRSLRGAREVL